MRAFTIAVVFISIATIAFAGGYCTTNRTTPMFPSIHEVAMMDKSIRAGGIEAGVLLVIELVKKGRAEIYPTGTRCKQVVDINQHLAIIKLPDGSFRFVGKVFLDCPDVEEGK